MKLSKMAIAAAIAMLVNVGNLSAADNTLQQVSHCAASSCDCGAPVCGCETACCDEDACCDEGCCESSCCDSGCCDAGGCGLGGGMMGGMLSSCLCDCNHGEVWSLFGDLGGPLTIGGWTQFGYHTKALPLFNSRPDNVQLQQQWLYAEKAIDTTCGCDIGGRFDYVYGTDGPDTQAFGISNGHWDEGWDNGNDYGHAIPQLYVEAGYGDFSVKAGKFYTIIGYEVVTAPDNFFYSHAYTFFNSEPFTHTGFLGTYNLTEDITGYGGYVLGWDSGFEDNGDAFLGGVSVNLTDRLSVTYATVGGVFAAATADERGYMHSIVTQFDLTDSLTSVSQSDFLTSEDSAGNKARETIGYLHYLLYSINDCWGVGTRFEWYQNEGVYTDPGDKASVYSFTTGVNYRPHQNVIIRPEVRWDWVYGRDNLTATVLENNGAEQTTFGFDTIFLF